MLIGGGGEKKTLRLVARYADACNLFAVEPAELARKLDVLKSHCDNENRDYDAIEKTVIGNFHALGDPAAFFRLMETYAGPGVTTVWAGPEGPDPAAWTAKASESLIPRLAEI